MNPRDDLLDDMFDLDDSADSKMESAREQMRQQIMKDKIAESQRRSKLANDAYNDLCDAIGVHSLNGGIESGGGMIRLPIESINQIVARIESLKTNALSEGAL